MSPDEEQIFSEAILLSSGCERDDFIRAACGDNQVLEQRIRSLISSHDTASFVLDRRGELAALNDLEQAQTERPGSVIGNYKLLQQIGEGGMGVVFMADQLKPVQRKVAIKIVKAGMDSRQVIARFEAERQALALMDHPNLTQVLDAGTTVDGRPYFVMDLVRGTYLTQYCDENRVPLRDRLGLFLHVCGAIHHAHQKGIIHRDIKPTNIMLTLHDGIPVPKVIDFGIAKALARPLTDKTLFTSYGALIGTPEYMSPEQAEMSDLDLDIRSDIYSLGVLLYELMTGSPPLESDKVKGKGLLEVCETIRNYETELPSDRVTRQGESLLTVTEKRQATSVSLRRFLRGDLDRIIMKALAKDRSQRYESASALSRDIERYLCGDPVEAASPTMMYKATKFVIKHRLACTFALILTVVLVASTIVSTCLAIQATRAKARAVKAEAIATSLGREKQNEAAASRAMTIFAMGHLRPVEQEEVKVVFQEMNSKLPIVYDSHGLYTIDQDVTVLEMGSAGQLIEMGSAGQFISPLAATVWPPELLEVILEEQRKTFGTSDPYVAKTLEQLGTYYVEQGQYEKADLYLRESLGIYNDLEDETFTMIRTMAVLARCLKAQGKTIEADELVATIQEKAVHIVGLDEEMTQHINELLTGLK